jgi:uncharacterized protein YdeI (BOF family)
MKKQLHAVAAVSGLALLLTSLSQVVLADNFIDAPRAITQASYQSSGRAVLAAAGADISIDHLSQLADGRRVRLNGTVERVQGSRSFLLHDETGRIAVKLSSTLPKGLKKGSDVAVSGRIERGLMGASIAAQAVSLRKQPAVQADNAKKPKLVKNVPSYSITSLPETGLVKVSGIVITANNAKQFVLKDATGLVDVSVDAANASHVKKGTTVTVIGSVDRGALGKDISAQTILIDKSALLASAD